jgi:hypothetical protein
MRANSGLVRRMPVQMTASDDSPLRPIERRLCAQSVPKSGKATCKRWVPNMEDVVALTRRHYKRILAATSVATLTTAIATVGSTGGPSDAGVSPAQTSLPSFAITTTAGLASQLRWQNGLRPYLDDVVKTARGSANFTGSRIDYNSRTLTIYGVAPPSPELLATMKSSPQDLAVEWRQTNFTESQLEHAIDAAAAIPGVASAGTGEDFAGIVVGRGTPETPLPAAVDGVPVTVVDGMEPSHAWANARGLDGGPFRGGQRITFDYLGSRSACSTGFRAFRGTNGVMISASHCTWDNNAVSHEGVAYSLYGNNKPIGATANWSQENVDVQLVDGAGYLGAIYTGSSSSDQYTSISGGTGYMSMGETVCTSGGLSGMACGQVSDPYLDVFHCERGCRTVYGTVQLTNWAGVALGGPGDSGSPAFQGDPMGQVLIAGILLGGPADNQWQATCLAFPTIFGVSRQCASRVYIAAWFRFKDNFSPALTLN